MRRVAASMMSRDTDLRIESIADIPLYDADEESAHGVPDSVSRLKDGWRAKRGERWANCIERPQSARAVITGPNTS